MGKASTSNSNKRTRTEANKKLSRRANGSETPKGDGSASTLLGDLEAMDDVDEDSSVDLEYHNRLVQASKGYQSDDQFKELLRLRFKLVANGVLRPKRSSLDNLQIPPSVLEKVGELFACLDWALSSDGQ